MNKEEELRECRDLRKKLVAGVLMQASTATGISVTKGASYRSACGAVYEALFLATFAAALRSLQNEAKVANGLTLEDALEHKVVRELVIHEIIAKSLKALDDMDPQHVWTCKIVKRRTPPQ